MVLERGFQHENEVCTIDCVDTEQWSSLINEWRTFDKSRKLYILKNYQFVFTLEEGIEPFYTLRVLEKLVQYGCNVHSHAFISQSLKLYFDKKYPNHKFTCAPLLCNIHIANGESGISGGGNPFSFKKVKSNDRKYRYRFFSWRSQPQRDSAWIMLKNLGEIEKEDNIFVKRERDVKITPITVSNYKKYALDRTEFDNKWVQETYFVHETEKDREVENLNIQDKGLYDAHINSYFDILNETIWPLEYHPFEIIRHQTSFSKRTFFPLLCRNVFHIYPQNKPHENLLKHLGFELFFESHEDFLQNCNIDFYHKPETQKKLDKNYNLMLQYLDRNWWL